MSLNNGSVAARCALATLLGVGLVTGPAAAETDFILRAPVAEVEEIAQRNGLTVIEQVEAPANPEGQGIYRVRAEEWVSPETVLEAIEQLEPTVLGIEEVTLARLPELDQSVMSILDQSVMSILDGLMTTRALTPPLGQAGPGLLGTDADRRIKKIKVSDSGSYEYYDEKLVFHMQVDENRHREDVTLRADFSPGCFVEYNLSERAPVEATGWLDFNGRKIEWEITNNTSSPITLSRVEVDWPAANLRLKKAKLRVEVKELFDPPSASIDFAGVKLPEDRQIDPGDTEKLTLEFEVDAAVRQADYSIVVRFAEGLSVASTPCSVIAANEPSYDHEELEWELINTSHDDVILESVTIGWPNENGLITKIEFRGRPVFKTETEFGKIFNGNNVEDRFVWVGYVDQLATTILRVKDAQKDNKGYSTVAIIDTGVDPEHWLLVDALVPGYDFLRDEPGYGSEVDGLDQSVMSILDAAGHMPLEEEEVIQLNQSVMSILDAEQGAELLNGDLPPAFGHGTMVAGIIHRVAPYASIMPLRVFDGNGQADLLDIVAAVYYAVEHGANVINMSFSIDTFSPELMRAINYAARNGVSCVASAGNEGQETIVYPAAFGNTLGVASSGHLDEISPFSNLGSDLVTVAAPGETIITTFPGGGWAVASGTSFAAPWISGAAAIFADKNGREHQPGRSDFFLASEALSHAVALQGEGAGRAGHGRADLKEAVDKLKGSADFATTGVSEHPYLIVVDFAEGCSVVYPPATSGDGCEAQVGTQLDIDGDKVELEITNAGGETISVARVEVTFPAAHEELKKIKLDGDTFFEELLPAPWVLVDSGWKDPDKPEKRQIEAGDTVGLRFEFEAEAGS